MPACRNSGSVARRSSRTIELIYCRAISQRRLPALPQPPLQPHKLVELGRAADRHHLRRTVRTPPGECRLQVRVRGDDAGHGSAGCPGEASGRRLGVSPERVRICDIRGGPSPICAAICAWLKPPAGRPAIDHGLTVPGRAVLPAVRGEQRPSSPVRVFRAPGAGAPFPHAAGVPLRRRLPAPPPASPRFTTCRAIMTPRYLDVVTPLAR